MKLGMFLKPVFTFSARERKVRLIRFGCNRKAPVGDWISWVVSITLWARWFHWERTWHQWYLVILGVGVHFRKSAGGYES